MEKKGLTTKEMLEIANSGRLFQETGPNSWVGIKIRKGQKMGVVIRDMNGAVRQLTVKFDDGTEEEINMNNIGPDPEYIHEYEWFSQPASGDKWYRF